MSDIRSFEDLQVFRRAYYLSLEIHKESQRFPQGEQYGFCEQLRRASKSICANIAEGFSKQGYSKREFKRFIQIALGSADEMRVWIRYCLDLGYIDKQQWERWRQEYLEIAKMLQGLYKSWN